jgi:hypothetical protein
MLIVAREVPSDTNETRALPHDVLCGVVPELPHYQEFKLGSMIEDPALEHAQGVKGVLFLPWQNVRRDLAQALKPATAPASSRAPRTTSAERARRGCASSALDQT